MSVTNIPVAGLRVHVRPYDGGVTVELHGELDLVTAPSFEQEVRTLSSRYDASQVTVDVSRLDFVDVQGIDALRRLANTWGPGERLTLRGSAPLLDALLLLVGGRDRFERLDA